MAPTKKNATKGGAAVVEKPTTAVQTTLEPPVDTVKMNQATQGVQKQLSEPTASPSQTETPTNGTGSDPFMAQLIAQQQETLTQITWHQSEITRLEGLAGSYGDLIGKLEGK
jgi:hypothetical protein